MSRLRAQPQLLTIPLELRDHIYSQLLRGNPTTLPHLLCTNRQILREAKPFIFRQPLTFDGQSELFEWLSRIDHEYLRYVTNITFRLHDLAPEKIIGALGKRLRQASQSNCHRSAVHEYKKACEQEIQLLGEAFALCPNVKDFAILDSTIARPSYFMTVSFSKMLAKQFPALQSLHVDEDLLPLTVMASWRKLRRLRFTGFSSISPAETRDLLHKFQDIWDLEIHTLTWSVMNRVLPPSPEGISWCFTREVLCSLPNLQRLTLYVEPSWREDFYPSKTSGVAKRIIDALYNVRFDSLRSLKIIGGPSNLDSTRQLVATFIRSSSLTHLEIGASYFNPNLQLPKSIKTLGLWYDLCFSTIFATRINVMVTGIVQSVSELPDLREIRIIHFEDYYFSNNYRGDFEMALLRASTELQSRGVKVLA
ncbi:hypothetical protein MMC12_002960 [Toensbergia leucococca]|nr:hypothetical protein [Toensbergia leucococca]